MAGASAKMSIVLAGPIADKGPEQKGVAEREPDDTGKREPAPGLPGKRMRQDCSPCHPMDGEREKRGNEKTGAAHDTRPDPPAGKREERGPIAKNIAVGTAAISPLIP